MNDFTKEELEFIMHAVKNYTKIYRFEELTIKSKIQSMIDNYCEHEHKAYAIGDSRPMIMMHECIKCGKQCT